MRPCPNCSTATAELLLVKDDSTRPGELLRVVECTSCRVAFLADLPAAGFDADAYRYYRACAGQPKALLFDPITERRYEEILASLSSRLAASGGGRRILDVGCGIGHFVDAAARRGWHPVGLELAEEAVEVARGFDLPVQRWDLFDGRLTAGSYDAITLFEVIEHVPAPGSFLARCEALLRPGGLMYLTTPNFASFDRRVMQGAWGPIHREHLTYFSGPTLSALIRKHSGLRVIDAESRNVSAASLRHLLAPLGRLRAPRQAGPQAASSSGTPTSPVLTEGALRGALERFAAGRFVKGAVNRFLSATGAGNTLVMLLER